MLWALRLPSGTFGVKVHPPLFAFDLSPSLVCTRKLNGYARILHFLFVFWQPHKHIHTDIYTYIYKIIFSTM